MSLSYVAKFASNEDIDTVASDLAQVFGFRMDPSHCGRNPLVSTVTLVAIDFEVDVTKLDTTARQMLLEDLNLVVDTCVRFYVWESFTTQSEGGKRIAEVTSHLLEKNSGNMALLFNEEQVLLLRLQSRIVINSTAGFWNPVTKSGMGRPFEEEPLPVI